MTLSNERTRSVWMTDRFLVDLLRKPRVPQWIRDEARRCLRHFPTISDMLALEELELKNQGVGPRKRRVYIKSQREYYYPFTVPPAGPEAPKNAENGTEVEIAHEERRT